MSFGNIGKLTHFSQKMVHIEIEEIDFLFSSGKSAKEEIIVAPSTPAVTTLAAQLTEDNEDFANRGRYHQSEVVQGENFDDYDSED